MIVIRFLFYTFLVIILFLMLLVLVLGLLGIILIEIREISGEESKPYSFAKQVCKRLSHAIDKYFENW